jgi:single-strand DNA-binding protein
MQPNQMQPDPQDSTPTSIVGKLTRIEMKMSIGGKQYLPLTVAVNRPLIEGDYRGEKVTDYHDAVAFGSLAEHAASSLRRGDRVVLTGRTQLRCWQGRDGTVHEEESIVVDGLGPDLRFNGATVRRQARDGSASEERF